MCEDKDYLLFEKSTHSFLGGERPEKKGGRANRNVYIVYAPLMYVMARMI